MLDLGTPFKLQSESYALANARVETPLIAQRVTPSDRGSAKAILIALAVLVAGALAFTYRKRTTR